MTHRAHPPRLAALLALAAALAGCTLKAEVIGATYTTADGEAMTTDGTTTSDGATTAAADTSDGATTAAASDTVASDTADTAATGEAMKLPYGDPCELPTPEVQVTAMFEDLACEGGVCLLVHDGPPPPCESDDACAPYPERAHCNDNGLCGLSPEYVEEHARCTQPCEDAGACPDIPGCEGAVLCAPIAVLGPLCCQKVCACADAIDLDTVAEREQTCALPGACA